MKIVEFTEEGELKDRCDYSEALIEIRDSPKRNGQPIKSSNAKEVNPGKMVLMYVHGWKHDASSEDEDFRHFKALLQELAEQEERAGQFRQVVGVYIGWPGSATRFPILEEFTFWGRKRAADRVAQAAYVSKLIGAIGSIICQRDNPDDFFVAIGHSFGARVLYSATAQVLLQNLQYAHPGNKGGNYKFVHGPADLVVLLNPAFEAAMYTAFDSSRRWKEQFNDKQQPLLLSIATTNDWATKFFFPLGQVFDLEWRERQKATLGNYSQYTTHDLVVSPARNSPAVGVPWYDENCQGGVCLRRRADKHDDQKSSPLDQKGNPFIIAETGPELLDGHNGIWGSRFRDWLIGFIRTLETNRNQVSGSATCRLQ